MKTRRTRRACAASLVIPVILLVAQAISAQIPAVVATSPLTLNSTFSAGPAVTDACGNIYVFESGGNTGVVEYQLSTGKLTTIIANSQGYTPLGGRAALYMDQAKKNLYFPDFTNYYTAHFDQLPIVNCAPGAINNNFAGNTGNLPSPNYYYGTANSITGDAAGDVFFTTTQSAETTIFGEVYNSSAATYSATEPLASWANQINYIASDTAGNIYFADQTSTYGTGNSPEANNIYLLKAGYTSAPTLFAGGFNNIVGLSFDAAGNLYVSDNGAPPNSTGPVIYEIPTESGTLNPSDKYAVASVPVLYKVAVDSLHDIVLSDYAGLSELKPGSAVAPSTAIGAAAATFPINYVFNAAVTPTSITTVTGTAPSAIFSAATGGCTVGTAYEPVSSTADPATSTCTVSATFSPTAAGLQTGALLFTSASGTVTTDLSGIGLAAQATIDPGNVVPLAATLQSPAGVAVDNLGDVFLTDSAADTLTEFPAASTGTGTPVSTGTLTLNNPLGVAVDNVGDIFIADTGNNRVVEVPVVAGALSPAATFALSPALKSPAGVATDGRGNLYIADTGDNNLLFVPNIAGSLDFAAATSNGASLNAPSAVTVDSSGNVFVAESANNDVLEFQAPFGASAPIKVASNLSNPTSLASDASGSLLIVDNGSSSIFRIPKVNGSFGSQTLAGSTVATPFGVAIDASGNLYVTDMVNDAAVEIQRVQAALNFGGWNVGTTSTPFTGTVNSSGTQALTFQSPSYTVSGDTSAGFSVTGDGCAGKTVAVGNSCAITATLTPPTTELNAEETLALQSNASNGMPALSLIGTGANVTPSTLTLTLAGPTPLSAGAPVTLTAVVGVGANTAVPAGSVKFYVNGTQVGTVAVTNDQAVLSLKNGLSAGTAVVVSADYTGDVINYSGSTASITVGVSALPDTLSLATITPYTNPASANDNAANPTGPTITLVATLTASGTIIPNGTVTFYSGSTILGTSSVTPAAGSTFTASLDTTVLRAGTTNVVENDSFLTTYSDIYAVYGADSSYAAATSNMDSVTVVGANPSANLASPNTTGATFAITPSNPTITVPGGGTGEASGSTILSFISYGGWQGYVNFTCSGLPAYAQCAPFPGAPLVAASTPTSPQPFSTVTFIINTNVPPLVPTASAPIWWTGAALGLMLLLARRRLKRLGHFRFGQMSTVLGAALLMIGFMAGISGCSSSSSGTAKFLTPKGTYNIGVTVHAAQLVANSTNTAPNDINLPAFQITLNVQ